MGDRRRNWRIRGRWSRRRSRLATTATGARASARLGDGEEPARLSRRTARFRRSCTTGCSTRCIPPSPPRGWRKPGELVKREQFAPLARENAGSLAEIGYFTTLKIDGKAVDFGSVTDYWMEERPDHLVEFHVTIPLKTPTPVGKFVTLAGRRSGIFHRLRIRRQGSGRARLRARGLFGVGHQAEAARRPTTRRS